MPGRHNVRNALAALAVAHWHGIKPQWAAAMLHDFKGAGRRFEVIGDACGVIVIDDYAHHPTEVAATLSAARLRYPTRRIWAVFQPHTYSRTQALLADYAHSFEDVDQVIFLDIYAAREKIDLGMHSRLLLERRSPSRCALHRQYRGRRGVFVGADSARRHRDHSQRGRRQSGGPVGAG